MRLLLAGEASQHRRSFLGLLLGLGVILAFSMVAAMSVGSADISVMDATRIIAHRFVPTAIEIDWPRGHARVVLEIRAPRVLLAAVVGASLALVGAVLQAATRNALADPYLFGVSAGGALGAVVVMVHVGAVVGIFTLPLAAFAGAALSLGLVLTIARQSGPLSTERLVLAGVAVAFLLTAATNFLLFLGDQRAAHSVVFWMLGGLGLARWDNLWIPAVALATGAAWLLPQGRALNALLAGEEAAVTLGIDAARLRGLLFALASLMTGVMVALAGAIGFVGLMVPHAVRWFIGGDNRRVLPLSAFAGAVFLVWVDVLARVLLAPQELPIGIITAALGGAFFVILMRRSAQ